MLLLMYYSVLLKLVDFQWKLGMAVSSDTCRSLKYPYVAVMLKVADHSGQVKTKCFEMTIPQFQVCDLTHPVLAHFFCNRRIKRYIQFFFGKTLMVFICRLMCFTFTSSICKRCEFVSFGNLINYFQYNVLNLCTVPFDHLKSTPLSIFRKFLSSMAGYLLCI